MESVILAMHLTSRLSSVDLMSSISLWLTSFQSGSFLCTPKLILEGKFSSMGEGSLDLETRQFGLKLSPLLVMAKSTYSPIFRAQVTALVFPINEDLVDKAGCDVSIVLPTIIKGIPS